LLNVLAVLNCIIARKKLGLWVGKFLKSKDFLKTTQNNDNLVAPLANEMAINKEQWQCGAP